MVFSTPFFIFFFLPVVLGVYYLSPKIARNNILLLASLVFYSWGEVFYVAVMLLSIVANYCTGLVIHKLQRDEISSFYIKMALSLGLTLNIGLLVLFKYANFIVDNVNIMLSLLHIPAIAIQPVHLPLGISFFTFQAVSYIVDVYRREVRAQKNIFNLALYISLFPQLIAGPIVRYIDIESQIAGRTSSLDLFSRGVQRFVLGLAKKMLIANPMGAVADNVFTLSGTDLTMPIAWIGAAAYSLQIFYDFSGYSDMAIGLGLMFGFEFRENFNFPYIAKSMREFWRRWHISLSTWFRDYVYFPLGGNRVSNVRLYINLLIVFFLTGFWHGASWNFIAWGFFHGAFLIAERWRFGKILEKTWRPIRHFYLLLVVICSWVIFRADNLGSAIHYLRTMFDIFKWHTTEYQYMQIASVNSLYVFAAGIFFSLPVYQWLQTVTARYLGERYVWLNSFFKLPKVILLSVLLVLSIVNLAVQTYNPFIYFRF